jgi:2-methylisocitrate lyase-like PEP mutase family enzyme
MAARADIPIMIDTDTGYGNAVNVHFAVQEMVRSGVAALSLEDQEAPKKSSTLAGRRVISQDEHVGKLQAAVAARDELDPEFVICARCDVLGAESGNFDNALTRCTAYVEKGGADLVWLNSVETREQLKQACKEIPAPVLAIWGGKDTPPTEAEYEKLGLRIVLYPVFCATAGLQAAWELLNEVREGAAPLCTRGTVAPTPPSGAGPTEQAGGRRAHSPDRGQIPAKGSAARLRFHMGPSGRFFTDRENEAWPRVGAAFVS